ncbi:MAG TPA: tetratricopeptide repeat protein [Kofleriaceae bacterium]
MAGEFPFSMLGHGVVERDGDYLAWIVFREPPTVLDEVLAGIPSPLARDPDGTHERIVAITSDEFPRKGQRKLYEKIDAWLAGVHARQPIRFVVVASDDEPAGAWHEWSKARVKKVLLPWFVEQWPALRSGTGAAVLAMLLGYCSKTRRADVIELAARAVELALGLDPAVDGALASHLATLVDRLPDDAAKAAQLAALSPALRLRVWAADASLVPGEKIVIETVRAVDRSAEVGEIVAELADSLEVPRLHELALEFPDAPMGSLVEVLDSLRGEALDRALDLHLARFAEDDDDLMTLLHSGIEKELAPLIDRCLVLAVDRDVPEIMANVLYATSHAGKPHETTRLGTEFVARYRRDGAHPGPILATLYTNILLAYGSTATCDDACRTLTLELEQLLDENPAYFGASGNAHRNILPSAYGSAACGRCVMGDGERAAAWLEKAREGEWDELALCANMVCFQHMKDDPHLSPVITAIGRAEVARLEKNLKGSHKDVGALFTLALTLHNGGFLDDAERYYTKVLALRPKHADSLNNVGNIHGTRGNIDAAIASYDQAIAVQPMQPLFHACKAWALARGQRWAECVEAGHVAVKLAPNQASGYFSRGAGYLGLGDRANAAEDWKRGAALNPGWRGSEKDDPWFSDMVVLIAG